MASKFSKFEQEVNLLLEANTSIANIATILKKSYNSITSTIQRIKRKNNILNPSKPSKIGRPKKLSLRSKRLLNRDLTKDPKVQNKTLLQNNSLDISKRSLQRFLKEEDYAINIAKKK